MFPTVIFERFYILRQHRSAKTAHQEPKKRLYLEFTQKATALQVVIDLTYKTITCFADACLIESAISDLVSKPADYTAVDAAIEKANALKKLLNLPRAVKGKKAQKKEKHDFREKGIAKQASTLRRPRNKEITINL